jgi:hypothetical protein
MKRIIVTMFAAVAMAIGLSSCEHQTMESVEITIQPHEWVTTPSVNYYFCTVRWDELDGDVVDYGTVNAYLIQNGRQNLLPLVTPISYDTDDDGVLDVTVAENIRFDIEYGAITFIIEDMDGYLPGDMAGTQPMTFRIVAIGD